MRYTHYDLDIFLRLYAWRFLLATKILGGRVINEWVYVAHQVSGMGFLIHPDCFDQKMLVVWFGDLL